jgi:hypothetical protein
MADDVKDVGAPEGMLKAYLMEEGDIRIGVAADLPGYILLYVPKAEAALAIPLKMGYNLHDLLCAAIATLSEIEEGGTKEELPQDKKSWN